MYEALFLSVFLSFIIYTRPGMYLPGGDLEKEIVFYKTVSSRQITYRKWVTQKERESSTAKQSSPQRTSRQSLTHAKDMPAIPGTLLRLKTSKFEESIQSQKWERTKHTNNSANISWEIQIKRDSGSSGQTKKLKILSVET